MGVYGGNYCALSCMFLALIPIGVVSSGGLSSTFYSTTCPKALSTVRTAVNTAVAKENRMGASLLRLHFHDCFVKGCDGSILLDDTANFTGEKTAGPNADSVRGFEVIDDIKSRVETICPGVVSCADILALAARDSVVALGGPTWTVQLGRRDSTTASLDDAETDIPSPGLDLDDLISAFADKGFNAKEMVALSGSHTIGQARCLVFRERIYYDDNIDSTFSESLKSNCPDSDDGDGDGNLSALDDATPAIFDNGYYKDLVYYQGLLHSDQELFNDGSTDSQVSSYADDAAGFYKDFAAAMVKMGKMTPLTGTKGQIRANCRKIN